ncbi:MAG TPA: methyltransferase domain-containing protein [Gemmatimonadaceae bacterium]|nr:methyltransferase domain-containing protein [Gemmatimonadaceae bacterium]
MTHETSKAVIRRLYEPAFSRFYFRGHGVDIGGGKDSLERYLEFFPLMQSCRLWDKADGDAQEMPGVPDDSYDFVHSSHCLEHLHDPFAAFSRWIDIVKPGGHIVVLVPDEDMYEQGVWPSTFNSDHKHTFTVFKEQSWSPTSVNVLDLVRNSRVAVQSINLLNTTHRHTHARVDQTLSPVGECAIEFVVRKEAI